MEDLTDKYPYFVGPMLKKYRTLDPTSEEAGILRQKISANIGDAEARRRIFGIEGAESLDIPQEEIKESATFLTIDSFLEKFGGNTILPPGVYIPEEPVQEDKSEYTLKNDEFQKMKTGDDHKEPEEEGEEDIAYLLKNRQYERALEIIELRNLNNREKNIYFADQIRFLKKLIKIEKQKNK